MRTNRSVIDRYVIDGIIVLGRVCGILYDALAVQTRLNFQLFIYVSDVWEDVSGVFLLRDLVNAAHILSNESRVRDSGPASLFNSSKSAMITSH